MFHSSSSLLPAGIVHLYTQKFVYSGCSFVCLQDYQTVLDLMREIILATDLAHHFKILKSLEEMAKSKCLSVSVELFTKAR